MENIKISTIANELNRLLTGDNRAMFDPNQYVPVVDIPNRLHKFKFSRFNLVDISSTEYIPSTKCIPATEYARFHHFVGAPLICYSMMLNHSVSN